VLGFEGWEKIIHEMTPLEVKKMKKTIRKFTSPTKPHNYIVRFIRNLQTTNSWNHFIRFQHAFSIELQPTIPFVQHIEQLKLLNDENLSFNCEVSSICLPKYNKK